MVTPSGQLVQFIKPDLVPTDVDAWRILHSVYQSSSGGHKAVLHFHSTTGRLGEDAKKKKKKLTEIMKCQKTVFDL